MNSELKESFQKALYNPEMELSHSIWLSIKKRENRTYKLKTWGHSVVGVASLFLLFPSVNNLIIEFSGKGFYEYLSLIFSDSSLVASYFKEFILSLVNSIPVVSLGISLFLLFVLFTSVQKLVNQFKSKLLLA